MLPQSETERLLEEHLRSLGVEVERRVELTSFAGEGTRGRRRCCSMPTVVRKPSSPTG